MSCLRVSSIYSIQYNLNTQQSGEPAHDGTHGTDEIHIIMEMKAEPLTGRLQDDDVALWHWTAGDRIGLLQWQTSWLLVKAMDDTAV